MMTSMFGLSTASTVEAHSTDSATATPLKKIGRKTFLIFLLTKNSPIAQMRQTAGTTPWACSSRNRMGGPQCSPLQIAALVRAVFAAGRHLRRNGTSPKRRSRQLCQRCRFYRNQNGSSEGHTTESRQWKSKSYPKSTPINAPLMQVAIVPETMDSTPNRATSAARSGRITLMLPIMIPALPKLAKPQRA